MKTKTQPNRKHLIGFFVDLYKRFPIPWWLFIIHTALNMVNTELSLYLADILIRVNKGELYNSVIISYALLYVGNSLIAWAANLFYYYGTNKVVLRTRLVLWKQILHLPVKDIEREQPASLISATTNDSASSCDSIGYLFLMISSVYSFIRACIKLYGYNATLAIYMIILIPLAVVMFWAVGKTQAFAYRKQRLALNEMTMYFAEHISAAKYVKAAAMEEQEINSGYAAIERRYHAGVIYQLIEVSQQLMFSFYNNLSTVMIAVFGSDMIRKGEMESTGITDFSTYMNKVNEYTSLLLTDYQVFKGSRATLERVSLLLNMEPEQPDAGDVWTDSEDKDVIFQDVHFGYTEGTEVLHGVSFRIPYGKTTAIIGDNGCGKSTLLKLMQGFYLPDSGQISVAGNQVGTVRLHDLREHFGYVLQNSELFEASLKDNVCYGAKEPVTEKELRNVGEASCLNEIADSLENGYDTVIGENGSQLSGGQRQRIAIARALLQKPDYLLLDEAGSALDYRTYAKIQSAVKEQMQGRTTVFIAHDMREIALADYVIVMDRGNIEAMGTQEEVAEASATYRDYVDKLRKKGAQI